MIGKQRRSLGSVPVEPSEHPAKAFFLIFGKRRRRDNN